MKILKMNIFLLVLFTCCKSIGTDVDPDEPKKDRVVDPNPDYKCKSNFGRYTHERYCHWYYNCHDRKASVRECAHGRYYDRKAGKCYNAKEVSCEGREKAEATIFFENEKNTTNNESTTTDILMSEDACQYVIMKDYSIVCTPCLQDRSHLFPLCPTSSSKGCYHEREENLLKQYINESDEFKHNFTLNISCDGCSCESSHFSVTVGPLKLSLSNKGCPDGWPRPHCCGCKGPNCTSANGKCKFLKHFVVEPHSDKKKLNYGCSGDLEHIVPVLHSMCNSFYVCRSNSVFVKECPEGTFFDVAQEACKDWHLVSCEDRLTPEGNPIWIYFLLLPIFALCVSFCICFIYIYKKRTSGDMRTILKKKDAQKEEIEMTSIRSLS